MRSVSIVPESVTRFICRTSSSKGTSNKNFIGKAMFLCALGRPRFNGEGSVMFAHKIGIWPFTKKIPTKRKSARYFWYFTKPMDLVTRKHSHGLMASLLTRC
ncbi:hypothetical protein BRADI_4g32983v3 [Brachypodium distachyon]|uniref:Uncharacterized protein n=1 Tax=Brachypodium distachyon TaxID=15368 RepID=A0A0Q3LDJ3_BRADI|nr:hypothetical protein BRADI_4g32983v3 [Brachypodium distachyon]